VSCDGFDVHYDRSYFGNLSLHVSTSVLETVNLFRALRRARFLFKLLVAVDVELFQPVSFYDVEEIASSGFSG